MFIGVASSLSIDLSAVCGGGASLRGWFRMAFSVGVRIETLQRCFWTNGNGVRFRDQKFVLHSSFQTEHITTFDASIDTFTLISCRFLQFASCPAIVRKFVSVYEINCWMSLGANNGFCCRFCLGTTHAVWAFCLANAINKRQTKTAQTPRKCELWKRQRNETMRLRVVCTPQKSRWNHRFGLCIALENTHSTGGDNLCSNVISVSCLSPAV